MREIVHTIGAIAFSILMYALPVVTTCAIVYKWYIASMLLFLPLSVAQVAILCVIVHRETEV